MSFKSCYLKKKISYFIGYFAEILVIFILTFKFHRVLKHRYRSKLGEIDIITMYKEKIFFIEVKARFKPEQIGYSITYKQRNRIMNAANIFLSQHPIMDSCEKIFIVYYISLSGIQKITL